MRSHISLIGELYLVVIQLGAGLKERKHHKNGILINKYSNR